MTGADFQPAIAPDIAGRVRDTLRAIEQAEDVRILLAIESGSRAWGFPSPDSDYDVRFVYARPVDWYLSIAPGRDVLERPIEDALDINGWDIRKALGLLLKPNPVLLEWLSSPIRYLWDDAVCARLIAFSQSIAHGPACLHHYLHMGERQWKANVEGRDRVDLKKYFYIVRPAAAIRWVRMHPEVPPPMDFRALVRGIDLSDELTVVLDDLLVRKSRSEERGDAARISAVDAFVTAEFAWARQAVTKMKPDRPDMWGEADALFRSIIRTAPP